MMVICCCDRRVLTSSDHWYVVEPILMSFRTIVITADEVAVSTWREHC